MSSNDNAVKLDSISISALRIKTLQVLATGLNTKKIFLSEDGLPRDWRGLAHFADIPYSILNNEKDPTLKLFDLWMKQKTNTCTLAKLQQIFGLIDRYDIYDDTNTLFVEDAISYLNKDTCVPEEAELDDKILTVHDTKLKKKIYDAFVLYDDHDLEFATLLIERLENSGLHLCVKDRDLVGGSFEHEAVMNLISERCNRLIVLISPEFLKSSVNKFFVDFTQSLQIEQRKRKIIPCMEKFCRLPANLQYLYALNYERSGRFFNFWEKLEASVREASIPSVMNSESAKTTVKNSKTKKELNEKKIIKSISSIESSPKRNSLEELKDPKIMPPQVNLRSAVSLHDVSVNNVINDIDCNNKPQKSKKWYKNFSPPEILRSIRKHSSNKEKSSKTSKNKKSKKAELAV